MNKFYLSKTRRFLAKYSFLGRIGLALAGLILVGVFGWFAYKPVKEIIGKIISGPNLLVNFFESPEENLQFSSGRTNVLLLGISGGGHDGADLTDTIIFASINIKSGDCVMLSIPRDIWLQTLAAKINSAYHYGEEKQPGSGGFILARDSIYQIVAAPIHYSFLVDFEGFVEAIDLVGGVNILVDQSFDDYQYPIEGKENDNCNGDPALACRYEHLHFDSDWQLMDGARALKYVRSRHAQGDEGTDFARSVRQQKVISSLTDKIISAQMLTNPAKVAQLIGIAKTYIKSDPALKEEELASFANILVRFIRHKSTIRTLSLDTGTPENPGFLVNPPESAQYQNQWVLIPRDSGWQKFQDYFSQKIKNGY